MTAFNNQDIEEVQALAAQHKVPIQRPLTMNKKDVLLKEWEQYRRVLKKPVWPENITVPDISEVVWLNIKQLESKSGLPKYKTVRQKAWSLVVALAAKHNSFQLDGKF